MAAMGPGLGRLPGAGDGRALAGRVDAFVATLPPRPRLTVKAALRLFELLPFPWRFSRLDAAAAEDFLVKMERSRSGIHRDLLLLAKLLFNLAYSERADVRAALGVSMSCAVREERSEPVWDEAAPNAEARAEAAGADGRELGELRPDGAGEDCEVLVIGSGAGGAAAACLLAEAGLDVLVLEAGGDHRHDHDRDEVMPSLARLYRDGGMTVAAGRPTLPIPVGRTIGGTTVINSGTCFRAPPATLARWRDEHGIGWAGELEGRFEAAEDFLRVRRLDPEEMGENGRLAMRGAARIGASGRPLDRNAGDCVQCGGCPLGCPIKAKRSMDVSYLPRAVAAGARLRGGVEARRLLIENGRCIGAECLVRPAGREHEPGAKSSPFTVRARQVVLAGGAFGTPELLARSGVGGPALGRNLRVHPATWVGALYPEPVRGWQGIMQSYYIDEWKRRGLFLEATFTPLPFGGAWLPGAGRGFQRALSGYDRVGSIGVHLTDRSSVGRIRLDNGGIALSYRLSGEEARSLIYGISRAAEVHFAAGALEVYPNIAGLPRIKPSDLPRLESARIRGRELRLEAFHPMGTARLGADPRRGVCDTDGAVHGVERLHVADASLFPDAVGVNPMMTVIAVAQQIAELLLERH